MKKVWLNMIVNALSLMIFMCMISSGLLLKFILPPGSGRAENVFFGSGHGRQKAIDVYWGLARHEWGEIHFYISLAFLAFLIFHLILHGAWIRSIAWGTKTVPQSKMRKLVTLGIVLFVIFALTLPWIGKKETYTRDQWATKGRLLS